MWVISICMKISHVCFLFTCSHFYHVAPRTSQEFQNFFFWGSQINKSCSPSYLAFSSACTWSLCLETSLSSWLSTQTPTSTPPCTSSSPTCPLEASASPPSPSHRCCRTSRHSKVITYQCCIIQMYFFILSVGLDDFLLIVMGYDCFVAICHHLYYTVITNPDWKCLIEGFKAQSGDQDGEHM